MPRKAYCTCIAFGVSSAHDCNISFYCRYPRYIVSVDSIGRSKRMAHMAHVSIMLILDVGEMLDEARPAHRRGWKRM
jgi:hypothetical protein